MTAYLANSKDALTAIAAILAVALAAWKWVFEEWLRRKNEIPTIDGDIEVEIIEGDARNVAVFFNTVWNNKGTVPIYLDADKTKFSVYEISTLNSPIAIDQRERAALARAAQIKDLVGNNESAARLLLEFHPIKDASWFMLEPKTKSRIQASVILSANLTYKVRCLIVVAGKADQNWFRKRLFSTFSH
jgi:hypothetical protein